MKRSSSKFMVSKKELRDPKKGLKDTRIAVYWPKEEIVNALKE